LGGCLGIWNDSEMIQHLRLDPLIASP
jgi:hypothetical protein